MFESVSGHMLPGRRKQNAKFVKYGGGGGGGGACSSPITGNSILKFEKHECFELLAKLCDLLIIGLIQISNVSD